MISGHYVQKFADASHVLFEGHLDDPSFRRIAVQKITRLGPEGVILPESGTLKVGHRNGRECVRTSYHCPIFGTRRTAGAPFKDSDTPAIGGQP